MTQSIGFKPAAVTCTRSCPAPACDSGTSRISSFSGPPDESIITALLMPNSIRRLPPSSGEAGELSRQEGSSVYSPFSTVLHDPVGHYRLMISWGGEGYAGVRGADEVGSAW